MQLASVDPDGDTLSYSATGLPAGLTITASTGGIAGTLTAGAGAYTVTAAVSDGSLTNSATFTWTVTAAAVLVQDTFAGTAGTLLSAHLADVNLTGSPWAQSGGTPAPTLMSTGAGVTAGSGPLQATIASGVSDVVVGADYRVGSGPGLGGLTIRLVDANNFLVLETFQNTVRLLRRQAGAWTTLASQALRAGLVAGSTHRLEARTLGSSVEGWWDGVRLLQVTEPFQQSATRHGLYWDSSYDATSRYGNFQLSINGAQPGVTVTADSVVPNSGTGATQTFSLQYSDTAGATDLSTAWVWFNATFAATSANSCLVYYNRLTNAVNLLNDAGSTWMTAPIGSAGTLQNSQCAVATGSSGAILNGMSLTLNLAMTFKAAFAVPPTKNIYAFATSVSGATSGWQLRGTWTIPSTLPPLVVTADSALPNAGTGTTQTFALQYSDTAGATDLSAAWAWFSATFGSSASSCLAYHDRAANTVNLLNDAGTGWMSASLGAAGTPQNSQCAIAMGGSTTTAVAGNRLTWNLALTFKPAFAGAKTVFMFGTNGTANSGWQNRGTWTVPGPAVTADSATPSSGSGAAQMFGLRYSDSAGATNLSTVWVWFNATLAPTAAGSCLAYYDRPANTVNLLNDAGTIWLTAPIGSGGTLQNSQCAIAPGSSTAVVNGVSLTLNLAMTFKPGFAGAKTIFMYGANAITSSGWQNRGSWTVP